MAVNAPSPRAQPGARAAPLSGGSVLLNTHDNHTQLLNISIQMSLMQLRQDIPGIQEDTELFSIFFNGFGKFESSAAPSCGALPLLCPSEYYWVKTSNGSAVRVYCDMTRSCGGVTGGWLRVDYLDKTNSNQMVCVQ